MDSWCLGDCVLATSLRRMCFCAVARLSCWPESPTTGERLAMYYWQWTCPANTDTYCFFVPEGV